MEVQLGHVRLTLVGHVLRLLTHRANCTSWLHGAGPEEPQVSKRQEGFVEMFWVLSILKQAEKKWEEKQLARAWHWLSVSVTCFLLSASSRALCCVRPGTTCKEVTHSSATLNSARPPAQNSVIIWEADNARAAGGQRGPTGPSGPSWSEPLTPLLWTSGRLAAGYRLEQL